MAMYQTSLNWNKKFGDPRMGKNVQPLQVDNSVRHHRCYNKESGRWSLLPCKDNNTSYIKDLLNKGPISLLGNKSCMRWTGERKEEDPRRISKNLAPQELPST